jgi:hypothetical protein
MIRVGVRAESERASERCSNDISEVVRADVSTHPFLSNGVDFRLLKGQECSLILLHGHYESDNDDSFD